MDRRQTVSTTSTVRLKHPTACRCASCTIVAFADSNPHLDGWIKFCISELLATWRNERAWFRAVNKTAGGIDHYLCGAGSRRIVKLIEKNISKICTIYDCSHACSDCAATRSASDLCICLLLLLFQFEFPSFQFEFQTED